MTICESPAIKPADNEAQGCFQNSIIKKNRKITDKCSLFLFITIFSIWIASCGYVICNELYPVAQIINNTEVNNSAFENYFTSKKWLFDTLIIEYPLCEGRFYCYGPDSVFIEVFFHFGYYHIELVLIFIIVLLNSTFLERKHYITFYVGLIVIGMGFILVSLLYRIALNVVSDLIPQQLCYKNFVFWIVPEIILCLLIALAVTIMRHIDPSYASHKFKRTYLWCYKMSCTIIFAILLIVIIIFLIPFTTGLVLNLPWTNFLLYTILGGSCYVAFMIYNFGNAVITVVIWNLINDNRGPFKTLLQALILVCRYHLGSVAFRATIILPLLVTWRERLHLKKTIEADTEKKFGIRIKSELERTKDEPSFECTYYKSFPPIHASPDRKANRGLARYFQNHYIVQVFKSSLMFVVLDGISFRDSTKAILLRHSMDQQLPSSTVFLLGWPYAYLLLLIINEASRSLFESFGIEAYNVSYFPIVCIEAYSRISMVMFVLGMMLMNNFELTIELCDIKCNDENEKMNVNAPASVKKASSVELKKIEAYCAA